VAKGYLDSLSYDAPKLVARRQRFPQLYRN
jgi:hypothetical protein